MSRDSVVYKKLKQSSTKYIKQMCEDFNFLPDLVDLSISNAIKEIKKLLLEHDRLEESSSLEAIAEYVSGKNIASPVDISGSVEFFKEYLGELEWAASQLKLTDTGNRKYPLLAHLVYKHLKSKHVFATPVTLDNLIEQMEDWNLLQGTKGLVIKNLLLTGGKPVGYLDKLEQEMARLYFYKTTVEGKGLLGKEVKTKGALHNNMKRFSRDRVVNDSAKAMREEDMEIIYLAYLTQVIPFRNTSILASKTKTFFGILREIDMDLSRHIQGKEVFQKTRIYESDGYTLVLRGRFVLIDNIRSQVIINKTPTDMAKKDIEMMVMLLTR